MRPFANESKALQELGPLLLLPVILLLCSASFVNGKPKPVKETKLAGLRPGIHTLTNAFNRFPKKSMENLGDYSWRDPCNGERLTLRADSGGPMWEVMVQRISAEADCTSHSYSREARARWGSGSGLLLKDRCERVEEIYGPPLSRTSSENENFHFETYRYSYLAKGKNTALTWDVTCATAKDGSYSQVYLMKLRVAGK